MRLFLSCVALAALGCGGAAGLGGGTPAALRGLPAAKDPPLDLDDDDDLGRARALYEALPENAPERAARRRELIAAYQSRMGRQGEDGAEGFQRFQQVLGLWTARELAAQPPPDLQLLDANAEDVFKRSSTRGADLEAVTGLVVLRAIHPADADKYDRTWKDILAYTNELAVAESGPGAERSRAIQMLEEVTAVFPSRWAGDKLVELYLARQEGLVKALAKGSKQDVLGAHRDPGIMRPTWNLVRAYARMGRLDEAVPVVEKLANQFGDEPEIRKRLKEMVTGKDGKTTIALMAAYVPAPGQEEGGDVNTALLICEDGAARLPQSIEPRKCAAELARVTDRVPRALRWVEEARKIAPDDHDIAEIAARLYLMRVADLTLAERLEAARARMTELEAFHADAAVRFKDKPLETSLADVYVVYGRGLASQGHVPDGIQALEHARKLAPSPDAAEELANIALKTGRYDDAEKGFEQAAAMPRDTPIETMFDGNRLRRLAGEAALLAGHKEQATTIWNRALKEWTDALGPQLNSRARAAAYTEVGRLYHDLGQIDKALQALNVAVDSDPEQTGVYGDVISFLVARGHYAPALDAYHRALGREEVTEYLKAYTSIWLYDLAKLRGTQPDASAMETLGQLAGGRKWYQQLAAFKLGKLTWDQLLAKADTRGKRAEAYFYEAIARFERGDRGGGTKFLHEVLATQMLGFFEHDMARYYLKFGVPGPEGKR